MRHSKRIDMFVPKSAAINAGAGMVADLVSMAPCSEHRLGL